MEVDKSVKEENKRLCEKYPFLVPINAWTRKKITDGAGFWAGSPESVPEYDYEYTKLDSMPDGWRKAFGEQMCEELREALLKDDLLDKYYVRDIKEKYGGLRWYANGGNEEARNIVSKYARKCLRTCICCGKPATKITVGWVSPYCDSCVANFKADYPVVDIEEYMKEMNFEN